MASPPVTGERRVVAVLGPTNTGKTHLAVERMLGHASGIIGLPLRLLAREIYDRIAAAKGRSRVALITGEERIEPAHARWHVCTVEAMPLERSFDFLAVDEIQLCADADRGHVFTDRLLRARGREETMFLGSDAAQGLIRRLVPGVEFISRPRLSRLSYAGHRKLSRLPKRSAIVAFSAQDVYAIAELVRRQRGGAAVVLGALSPRTRNAQVAMFQAREVDFLVATDAIGMGLNMAIEHVAFAELSKFDGELPRQLYPGEVAQIAGRAGRHMNDGTFGTTAELEALSGELVERVEGHRFDPIRQARWRNSDLDFANPESLIRSLDRPPPLECLLRARDADDYLAFGQLARQADIAPLLGRRDLLRLLWQVCQIPDFRKTSHDSHVRLLGQIFRALAQGEARLPADWVARQVAAQDRTEGDIDTLAQRIAHIRTWTYISHREDWLADAAHWQERSRAIEDRLSDALHERLTQRFVDRRTAVLMSRLKDRETLSASVDGTGAVSVAGQHLGRLLGLSFIPDLSAAGTDGRALRAAANRSLHGAFRQRARLLMRAGDDEFALDDELRLAWRGEPLGRLMPGDHPLRPRLRLIGGELLDGGAREAIQKRMTDWLAREIGVRLRVLRRLETADLPAGARGIAFQLVEGLGKVARRQLARQISELDPMERKRLAALGVRLGRRWVYMPLLVKPAAQRMAAMLWCAQHGELLPPARPPGRFVLPADGEIADGLWLAMGFQRIDRLAIRIDMLERLMQRTAAEVADGPKPLSAGLLAVLGLDGEQTARILRVLGFELRPSDAGPLVQARRRRVRQKRGLAPEPDGSSPFAKLKELVASG
ncbi:MAG: disulfide oxidoreductase [Alphaproteobacteria bacterium]|nr:disulfide oxidoreductase [Alphaproteobacteria bacterium]